MLCASRLHKQTLDSIVEYHCRIEKSDALVFNKEERIGGSVAAADLMVSREGELKLRRGEKGLNEKKLKRRIRVGEEDRRCSYTYHLV